MSQALLSTGGTSFLRLATGEIGFLISARAYRWGGEQTETVRSKAFAILHSAPSPLALDATALRTSKTLPLTRRETPRED
jgi:hypothetical protein